MMSEVRYAISEVRSAARDGFTLIELLMAMFIMSIGLVAVASIFPVSSYLQKQTFEETLTLQVKRNAESILYEMPIDAGAPGDDNVHALSDSELSDYPLSVRSYPLVIDKDNDGTDDVPFTERDLYWVPLVQKDGSQWRVFVFILVRNDRQTYENIGASELANAQDGNTVPKVGKLSASVEEGDDFNRDGTTVTPITVSGNVVDGEPLIQPSDQILSSNGTILQVLDFGEDENNESVKTELHVFGDINEINAVWFGLPPEAGRAGTARRIIVLGKEAVKR